MPISLQVALPSGEVITCDADGNDVIEALKAKVASLAMLNTDNFTLTFEGVELGNGEVGELPLEDQSMLSVVLSKKKKAARWLKERGWKNCEAFSARVMCETCGYGAEKLAAVDSNYREVLEAMSDAAMCSDRETMGKVLQTAASLGFVQCLELLLVEDLADVEYGKGGPLLCSVIYEREAAARMLLQYGANPNTTAGESGAAALHCSRNPTITQLLVERRADPNIQGVDGRTPLHYSVNHPDVVRVLLAHNADPLIKDNDGMTPLDCATARGSLAVADVLWDRVHLSK